MKHIKLFEAWNEEAFKTINTENDSHWTTYEINDLEKLGAENIEQSTWVFNQPGGLVIEVTKTKPKFGRGSIINPRYVAKSNKKSRFPHADNKISELEWMAFLNKLNEFIESGGEIKLDAERFRE